MNHMPIKFSGRHFHLPHMHDVTFHIHQLTHNDHFWAAIWIAAAIGAIAALIFLAQYINSGGMQPGVPMDPFHMYPLA